MTPQQPRADGVKCSAPERLQFAAEQVSNAVHHFACGFVGEGQEENTIRRDAVFEQPGDAIGERASFAGARSRDDERRTGRGGDGGVLLLVEFLRVVDLEFDRRVKRLQHVVARHAGRLVGGIESRKKNADGRSGANHRKGR